MKGKRHTTFDSQVTGSLEADSEPSEQKKGKGMYGGP